MIVLLTCLIVVACVFLVSRVLSDRVRSRVTDVVRSEIIQIVFSAVIIVVILITSQTACSISATYSNTLTGTRMAPFDYASYYLSNLAFKNGLGLYTTIFSQALSYQVASATTAATVTWFLSGIGPGISKLLSGTVLGAKLWIEIDWPKPGDIFSTIATTYLGVLSPLVMLSVGVIFLQYLLLPLFQYLPFTVLLPAAIALRAIPFTGSGLRNASNIFLALAIALYIVYPLTLAFNSWIVNWVYCIKPTIVAGYNPPTPACNPLYPYLGQYLAPDSNILSGATQPYTAGIFGSTGLSPASLWSQVDATSFGSLLAPFANLGVLDNQVAKTINLVVQYSFQAIILLGFDLAITIAFAGSLARALNSFEGSPFWRGI